MPLSIAAIVNSSLWFISGARRNGAWVKFAEILRFGVPSIRYARPLSRRSAPVTVPDGPARQVSPTLVT